MSDAREKRKAFIKALKENPEKFKKDWDRDARKAHPEMTEDQLKASWEQLAEQFGL